MLYMNPRIVFQKTDSAKRFEYLLQQTEMLSQFMVKSMETNSSTNLQKSRKRKQAKPFLIISPEQ